METCSRRDFMHSGLAVAGWAAAGSVLTHVETNAGSVMNQTPAGGGYRLGLVTYNIAKDWDIPTLIKNCEETGFGAVELRTTHAHGVEPTMVKDKRIEVRKLFGNSKVRLLSLGTTCEYHSPDRTVVEKNIEETKRFVELALDVGALGVKVRPNGIPADVPEEKTLEQIGKALRICGEAAADAGVEIWLEVHGKDSNLPRRIRRMMEVAGHPRVGICWNSNPQDIENQSIGKSFELLKPWLKSAHITELWRKDYPWQELFSLMNKAGYDRYTLAEIPESQESIRLMHYYAALWQKLKSCG